MHATKALEGRIAVVTGAARGLGSAYAAALAGAGARVVIADIDGRQAVATAAEIRGGIPITVDVSSEGDVERLFATVRHELGRLDILINNAAASPKCTSSPGCTSARR
ncbi:MAG: SDR family NAD(P)-dependent oxidoreductase [Egibacteraceae bacterium]